MLADGRLVDDGHSCMYIGEHPMQRKIMHMLLLTVVPDCYVITIYQSLFPENRAVHVEREQLGALTTS
jgi:hypothetical protein